MAIEHVGDGLEPSELGQVVDYEGPSSGIPRQGEESGVTGKAVAVGGTTRGIDVVVAVLAGAEAEGGRGDGR